MAHLSIPDSLQRIFKTTLVLIFISTFSIVGIGMAAQSNHNEIKKLNKFLIEARDVQPNFEQSLILYTEKTENIISYLLNLRPSSEKDFVRFIFDLEKVATANNLTINLQSLAENPLEKNKEKNIISYNLSFFGTATDLENFLADVESMNYFIEVEYITFRDPKFIDNYDDLKKENINLMLKLFVNNNAEL